MTANRKAQLLVVGLKAGGKATFGIEHQLAIAKAILVDGGMEQPELDTALDELKPWLNASAMRQSLVKAGIIEAELTAAEKAERDSILSQLS